jgi:hypothetical protein
MPRAATDVMQSIIFAAVADAMDALKAASRGVPNTMLRDIQAVHRNAMFSDLPKELQDSIANSVRSAFTQLLKEGYAVAPAQTVQTRSTSRVPDGERRRPAGPQGRGGPRGPGRGPRPGGPPRNKPRG